MKLIGRAPGNIICVSKYIPTKYPTTNVMLLGERCYANIETIGMSFSFPFLFFSSSHPNDRE